MDSLKVTNVVYLSYAFPTYYSTAKYNLYAYLAIDSLVNEKKKVIKPKLNNIDVFTLYSLNHCVIQRYTYYNHTNGIETIYQKCHCPSLSSVSLKQMKALNAHSIYRKIVLFSFSSICTHFCHFSLYLSISKFSNNTIYLNLCKENNFRS